MIQYDKHTLYSLVTAVSVSIEVVEGTATFRVRCTSTGGRALDMTLSGPDGYSADISSRIQPDGDRRYLGSDVYTATTDVISGGRDEDVYLCNVTSSRSVTGSTTLRGCHKTQLCYALHSHPLQLLLQPLLHWS